MRTLVLLAMLAVARSAAAVTVTATIDPAKVAAGESADLAIAIEGSRSTPMPQIANTGGLSVTYVGPASQMSFVNGRMSTSITHHFTVVGTKPGRYAIGPISVDADGTAHDAGTVSFEIVAPGAAGAGDTPAGDQITLALSVARNEVYLREHLPLTLKLLVGSVRITDLQFPQVPGDGFALDKFPQPAQHREQTPHGVMQVVEFHTTLTPLKTGPLTVGPATMGMSLVVQGRRRGFFDGFFDESRPMQAQSDPITLTVLPLPSEGRPASFTGAVGQFTFDVTAAPTDVAAGDPVTVRSVIRGDGSLDGVAPPAVVATDRFRVYPTQATAPAEGSNERVFEQVVIPLRDGTLPLTLPRFSFFDPAARAYRTIAPAPITLTVRASAKAHAAPEIVGARPAAPVAPERPETLGRDIVFIKDAPGTLTPIGAPPRHRHPIWWLLQLIPILLWAGASQVARRRRRLSGDLGYARFTRAGREARTALAAAQATLARGDVTGSHDAVAAALRDYLAAKLGLPPGTVGESAPAHLRAGGVEAALVDQIVGFFTDCEAARFAPGDTTPGDVERALASADTIVRSIERRRGLGPARVAGCLVALAMAATAIAATSDGPSALFIRANGLYGEEHYAEAAATYEQILAGGVESGAVQFNLGNAYLKTGDVGHAVLAYERARRHIPGDPDLAANLGFARELAHDVIPPTLGTTLAFPFAERATTSTLATVTMAAWWTVWLALAGAALLPGAASVCRAIAFASGFVATVAGSSGAYRWWTIERPALAVVVARDDVTVRSEPTPNATALFVAKPGTVLEVDRTREGSSSVTSRDGRRGWVESPALAPL